MKLVALLALVGATIAPITATAGEVHLSAAASLREALTELTQEFAKSHAETKIRTNHGGSGALAKQIEQGAPADIFIPASREWADYLQVRKMTDASTRATFAYNRLVFAGAPKAGVAGMKDIVTLRKIAIGSPKSVPAGEYAVKSMRGAGIDKEMAARLVIAKDVREALKYAERGEVDGAFVYRTDAMRLAKRTRILFTVPEELHDRVTYPMVLTTAGAKKTEARDFFRFLGGAEARNVLVRLGFEVQ